MVQLNKFPKSLVTLSLVSALSACGGGGSDSDSNSGSNSNTNQPDPIQCTAPQVLNTAATACVDPEPQPQPEEQNSAPTITSATSFSVDELTKIGESVYTASATDVDGDNLSWTLVDDKNIFTINAETGELTVKNSASLVAANLSDYKVTLTVSDDATNTLSASITLDVTVKAVSVEEPKAPELTLAADEAAIFYYREDGDYTDWAIHAWNNDACSGYADFEAGEGTDWEAGLPITDIDPKFGAYWLIKVTDTDNCLNYIVHKGNEKDPNDNDQTFMLQDGQWNFIVSGDGIYTDAEKAYAVIDPEGDGEVAAPLIKPDTDQGIIYYRRDDQQYDGWTIHAWNNEECDAYNDYDSGAGTEWSAGLTYSGVDDNYGAYWLFDTKADAICANFIVHNGDNKDPVDGDQKLKLEGDRWVFVVEEQGLFESPEAVPAKSEFSFKDATAHLVGPNVIVTKYSGDSLSLLSSADAMLDEELNESYQVQNPISLSPGTLTEQMRAAVPHLLGNEWHVYEFEATSEQLKELLKQQLVLANVQDGKVSSATYVQTSKALDAIYTAGENDADEVTDYGVSYSDDVITVKTWAPTATDVKLVVFDDNKTQVDAHDMVLDSDTGVWSFTTTNEQDYDRLFYQFKVTAYHPLTKNIEVMDSTDPYSVNTSTNGRYSQFVNMTDDDLKPSGWDDHVVPTISNFEDGVLLEGHIRDFSITDLTTSEANRGKYLAFTEAGTDANNYLTTLAGAGVTHFHMLPANDIATINEDLSNRVDLTDTVGDLCALNGSAPVCGVEDNSAVLNDVLANYDPASNDARDLVNSIKGRDGFNWGYDPHHFNVVEGSYSSNPEGVSRIKEFREMVQALHGNGLRVVLDVVFNHTSASGLWDNSVFDKLVPGYYHRYNELTGSIEKSTCCDNTATENRMMGKFVVDSLEFWTRHYGLDGFRFDVMGHMPSNVILDGYEAVKKLDADTYFYGEGWNWGEVKNNRLFHQATQYNLAGSEVGTFNDRPRDSIREAALSRTSVSLGAVDHIRLGMAGTLQNYVLEDQNGDRKKGIDFSQSSYALDPADIINYVSKHDNETLWDNLQYPYNLGESVDAATRVRVHSLSAALPLMSQGLPFFQLGVDKLRSKSMDRNTYDAGDWYNKVDYTNSSNNWNVGQPIEVNNAYEATISSNANIPVTAQQIEQASSVFTEFLQIRKSSPLFRLTEEAQVIRRLGFHNTGSGQTAGLIVMSIDDGTGVTDLDPDHDALVVVVNGTDAEQSHAIKSASGFTLHTIQQNSADTVVRGASFAEDATNGSFTVPAHTIAVFVKEQSGAQGDGLAADPDYVVSPYSDAVLQASELSPTNNFEYDGRGEYSVSFSADAGTIEFNITDTDMSAVDLTLADITVAEDSIAVSAGTSENFSVDLQDAGGYRLTLNVLGATPELKLELLHAVVSCETPISAGDYPIDLGAPLYLRGAFEGWSGEPSAENQLLFVGDNEYQVMVDIADSTAFKIADPLWDHQILVGDGTGKSLTSGFDLGAEQRVLYNPTQGNSDNKLEVTQGTYLFTLTLDSDSLTTDSEVGSLRVDQCQ